jgi:TP901 family phage tail tape measure protein
MDNLQDAVNLSGSSLSIFGREGLEMADIMDTMASVASNVTTNTQSYSNVLGQVSGAANAANLSFKETNMLISAMVTGGVNLNLATAAINSAFISIQEPLKGADTALEEMGLSMTGLQSAFEAGPIDMMKYLKVGFDEATKAGIGFNFLVNVLGKQAAPEFAVALSQTNESLDNVSGYFDNASGTGEIMVQKLRDGKNPAEDLTKAINDLQIAVGSKLVPQLTPLIDKLTTAITKFSELSPATQGSIVQFAGLLAMLGPVVFAIGKVVAFLNPLTAALSVCAVAAAGMATTSNKLVEGFWGLFGPIPQIIWQFKHLKENIDNLTGALGWLWEKVTGTIDKLGNLFNLVMGRSITIPINYQENTPSLNYSPSSGSNQAGSDFIPRTGMYMLHRGEQVVPTSEVKGGGTGGSTTVNINFNNPTVRSDSDLEDIKNYVLDTLGRNQELNQRFGINA